MLTDLVAFFPNLATEPYVRTSEDTFTYNCIAYASGDQTRRWDPGSGHWPDDLPKAVPPTLSVLMSLFAKQNYARCGGSDLEAGYEKIAIYGKGNRALHAAKQLADGTWTSKLGDLDDITHTLNGLVGDLYGRPLRFMRRRIAAPPA